MKWLFLLLVTICCYICNVCSVPSTPINPSEYGIPYHYSANNATGSIKLGYDTAQLSSRSAARIVIESADATPQFPILVVVRQQSLGVISWQVPLVDFHDSATESDHMYHKVSRTLCPGEHFKSNGSIHYTNKNKKKTPRSIIDNNEGIVIGVSCDNSILINFTVTVILETDLYINEGDSRTFSVSPSERRYFAFNNFAKPSQTLLVEATSPNETCTKLFIKNLKCPVFDRSGDVSEEKVDQTLTTQGAVIVTREMFPHGFFIGFLVYSDDDLCTGNYSDHGETSDTRIKDITLKISEIDNDYAIPITYSVLLNIVICTGLLMLNWMMTPITTYFETFCSGTTVTNEEVITSPSPESNALLNGSGSQQQKDSTNTNDAGEEDLSSSGQKNQKPETTLIHSDTNRQSTSQPNTSQSNSTQLRDAENSPQDPNVDTNQQLNMLEKKISKGDKLFVTDLYKLPPKVLHKKSIKYVSSLIHVAVFYTLPVIQLVYTHQRIFYLTGDQDTCFYNFLCSRPSGGLHDFNHVLSNFGYLVSGVVFIALVKYREIVYRRKSKDEVELLGLPQQSGLYYAMGIALIGEGVLSGCYHVCPTHNNFQFDTTFMYIMAALCVLKLYQNRHPDLHPSAAITFIVISAFITIGVLGIVFGNLLFWYILAGLHFLCCFFISVQVYYAGCWKWKNLFKLETWKKLKTRPYYPCRLALIIVGNIVNFSLTVIELATLKLSFALCLLILTLTNLFIYTIYYMTMKFLVAKERISPVSFILLLISGGFWIYALINFLNPPTSWETTAAESRTKNSPCVLFDFFDQHDIWHFYSASALFSTFIFLLTLDDNISQKKRSEIMVF